MDRPPVNTDQTDQNKIVHRLWPCVHHPPEMDCVTAQEVYLRSKHALVPRKVSHGKDSG